MFDITYKKQKVPPSESDNASPTISKLARAIDIITSPKITTIS
jgi:hypothetical protein